MYMFSISGLDGAELGPGLSAARSDLQPCLRSTYASD